MVVVGRISCVGWEQQDFSIKLVNQKKCSSQPLKSSLRQTRATANQRPIPATKATTPLSHWPSIYANPRRGRWSWRHDGAFFPLTSSTPPLEIFISTLHHSRYFARACLYIFHCPINHVRRNVNFYSAHQNVSKTPESRRYAIKRPPLEKNSHLTKRASGP